MSPPNERHVLLPVICEHCQQKQIVQMRARSEFHAMYPQSVKCVKCENSFDVTIPDQILGGPFLPSQQRVSAERRRAAGRRRSM
jgi:hypothetical protein